MQDEPFGGAEDIGVGLGLDAEFADDDNDVRLDIAPAEENGGTLPLQVRSMFCHRLGDPYSDRLINGSLFPKGFVDGLNAVLEEKNMKIVLGSLEGDFSIHEAGNGLGIAPPDRIVDERDGSVRFFVMDNMFNLWREEHEVEIGCKFIPKESAPMAYKERPKYDAQASWVFICSYAGKPSFTSADSKGGKSGVPRQRQPSKKSECKARFTVYFGIKRQARDNTEVLVTMIRYQNCHNHDLASADALRHQRKSDRAKKRIKALLLRGLTVHKVMEQLGMDAERARRRSLMTGRSRLTRDDFITYSDVANILRGMVNQEVQKHQLENFSAEGWMRALKEEGYFTHFDEEMGTVPRNDGTYDKRGQYHGFASKWQLEQLLAYGDTICIDGTHKVYGYVEYSHSGLLFVVLLLKWRS
jgi:hypothetical protein